MYKEYNSKEVERIIISTLYDCEIYGRKYKADEPFIIIDDAQVSNLNGSGNYLEIAEGEGHFRQMTWETIDKVDLLITSGTVNLNSLIALTGAKNYAEDNILRGYTSINWSADDDFFTLPNTPILTKNIFVLDENKELKNFTIEDEKISIQEESGQYEVFYYYNSEEKIQTLLAGGDGLNIFFKVEIYSKIFTATGESSGIILNTIPKVKILPNITVLLGRVAKPNLFHLAIVGISDGKDYLLKTQIVK